MEGQYNIRWRQRLKNYNKALSQLTKFIEKRELNELEGQGLIQAFKYTYELAWNVMKDYYEFQGSEKIQGSRDAIRLAFRRGLISDGEGWMKMLDSRTRTSHTYDEEVANSITDAIFQKYYDLFVVFQQNMNEIAK